MQQMLALALPKRKSRPMKRMVRVVRLRMVVFMLVKGGWWVVLVVVVVVRKRGRWGEVK